MKVKHIVLCAICITLAIWIINSNKQTNSLHEDLKSPTCKNACWQGIEPGTSTTSDVTRILASLDIEFNVVTMPSGELVVYEWGIDEDGLWGAIDIYNGLVTQITLPIDQCVLSIVDTYGEPELYHADNYYFFVYDDENTIFSLYAPDNLYRASVIFIRTESDVGQFGTGFRTEEKLEWDKAIFDGSCDDNSA